jgi:hypothetical protein
MDTKLKADIAESAVATELLKHGFDVLKPCGDRLSYDLAVAVGNKLIRIQVKSAWIFKKHKRYVVDVRQTKTNRRRMIRKYYNDNDFDFAIVYIQDLNDFFVIPVKVFTCYKSTLTLAEIENLQVKFDRMKMKNYYNRWDLLGSSASND